MTENNGNDRRRAINGRIDTLGTGTNGVSGRRTVTRISNRRSTRHPTDDGETAEAALADEETDEEEQEQESEDAAVGDDEDDSETESEEFSTEADGELSGDADSDADEDDEEADAAAVDDDEAAEDSAAETAEEDDEEDDELETRTEDFDKRSTLEVEVDPFVRAYAARRAAEKGEESLDEYIVGSVKGYLAGLLGGDVSSPETLERDVEVEADEIFGGLLETIAEEDESTADVVIAAVAEAYDVPVDEETLVVAGLRDHEALLNGVVANSSNDLDDVSEVVQAAVETRLIEEPA
jgi:hypothetical protein